MNENPNNRSYLTYASSAFAIDLPSPWHIATMHTIQSPRDGKSGADVSIKIDPDVAFNNCGDYAACYGSDRGHLPRCRLKKNEEITLANGLTGRRIIYTWYPHGDRKQYRQDWFFLVGTTGYHLRVTYTRTTWYKFGNDIERIMNSFTSGTPDV